MATPRRTRLPISCEPCRTRKIRCTRDATPCSTCIRRKVHPSQCVYTRREPSIDDDLINQHPISPPSSTSARASTSSPLLIGHHPDLAARVAKLEQLLQAQSASPQTSNGHLTSESNQTEDVITHHPEVETPARGKLHVSKSGHMRFIPSSSTWSSALGSHELNDDCPLLDSSNGPFPFGRARGQNNLECLASLPPLSLCRQLKDVYFTSFAPVCTMPPIASLLTSIAIPHSA
jgi:Fungal Zn(2)-Cys(6) binuclear cluster domain